MGGAPRLTAAPYGQSNGWLATSLRYAGACGIFLFSSSFTLRYSQDPVIIGITLLIGRVNLRHAVFP